MNISRQILAALFLFSCVSACARPIKFTSPNTFSSGVTNPGCIAVGDFNRDGHLDLAVTDHINSVAVFLGNGNGTFSTPTLYTLNFYVVGCVAAGDFNGDHKLDLIIIGGEAGLALLTGNGDGTFNPPTYITTALAGASLSVALGRFNEDHHLDMFIGGNSSSEVIFGEGKGEFSEGQMQPASGFSVTIGDFNRDGNLDVACTSPFTDSVSVLLGNGDGTFQTPQVISGLYEPIGITSGDFNRDKKLDLAVTLYNGSSVLILLGNGDGTFNSGTEFNAGFEPGSVVAADFNKDHSLDLAASDYGENGVSILSGSGDGTFRAPMFIPTGNNPSYISMGDFNDDGSTDLVVANDTDSTVSVLLNTGGTRVKLDLSHAPDVAGRSISLTARVTATVMTSVVPTGKVSFWTGERLLGAVPLHGGKAAIRLSGLKCDVHRTAAYYSGDATFNPNVSPSLDVRDRHRE